MSNKRSYGLNIGASSILVIIVILCLICFAGLSIASSNADYRLSKKLADRETEYYDACNKAQIQLQKISTSLHKCYQSSLSKEDYENKIKESYADSLTFSYPINDNQVLEVCVLPQYPITPSDNLYQITAYHVVTITTPKIDDSLPVFLGN